MNKRFYKCTSSTVVNNVAKAAARLYRNKAYTSYTCRVSQKWESCKNVDFIGLSEKSDKLDC